MDGEPSGDPWVELALDPPLGFPPAHYHQVIAKLIGWYLDNGATTVKEATSKALSRCDGTWGIAVMSHSPDDDEVVVACNGSPMTIGLGQGKTFIASEPAAFNKYTKNFIAMQVFFSNEKRRASR